MQRTKSSPCIVRSEIKQVYYEISTQENLHLNLEKPALFGAGWIQLWFDSLIPTVQILFHVLLLSGCPFPARSCSSF